MKGIMAEIKGLRADENVAEGYALTVKAVGGVVDLEDGTPCFVTKELDRQQAIAQECTLVRKLEEQGLVHQLQIVPEHLLLGPLLWSPVLTWERPRQGDGGVAAGAEGTNPQQLASKVSRNAVQAGEGIDTDAQQGAVGRHARS